MLRIFGIKFDAIKIIHKLHKNFLHMKNCYGAGIVVQPIELLFGNTKLKNKIEETFITHQKKLVIFFNV